MEIKNIANLLARINMAVFEETLLLNAYFKTTKVSAIAYISLQRKLLPE